MQFEKGITVNLRGGKENKMECKYSAYIYGSGNMYSRLAVYFHQWSDRLKILGIVTTLRGFYKKIDGYDCLTLDEVDFGQDFVIIAVEKWKEIYDILIEKGVEGDKIIRGSVFSTPGFDFEEYIKLKESNVSILSNNCLGGLIYKQLGLKITSPTVSMFCRGKGYLDFLERYEYYLNCEMKKLDKENFTDDMTNPRTFYLKGILGDDIVWVFNHSQNADETIALWNRRKLRFNYSNVAALMTIQNDEEAFRFEELRIEKRLGIYYKQLNLEHVIYVPEWIDNYNEISRYGGNFSSFANHYMIGDSGYVSPVNWIQFLLGYKVFQRKILW